MKCIYCGEEAELLGDDTSTTLVFYWCPNCGTKIVDNEEKGVKNYIKPSQYIVEETECKCGPCGGCLEVDCPGDAIKEEE